MTYDFAGWATKNDTRCSDGVTIRKNAFKKNDGIKVPLVWNHQHNNPYNTLGSVTLENRDEGVYAYGSFNNSEAGKQAKEAVIHGDINRLSIWANDLVRNGSDILGGNIREVSLVLAGANPGAYIETVNIAHSEDGTEYEEAIIYSDIQEMELAHSEDAKKTNNTEKEEQSMANKEKTIGEIFETLSEEQKQAVYAVIGYALENEKDMEDEDVKHNAFDNEDGYMGVEKDMVLSHSEQMDIISDAKRMGSLKDAFLSHAAEYGIDSIDWLFPEAKNVDGNIPSFINNRPTEWVSNVMSGVHHTPFSRIKSMFADIREDEARARGYMKGKLKKEEVFSLLKRTTDPQTIYKKQKLDRDDVIDITDFDVVSWIKGEMRVKLDEELARAILFGDGRLASDDDKIQETHIRPVYNDSDLYTIKKTVTPGQNEAEAHAIINAIIKSFDDYQGSGAPVFYTTQSVLSDMLLLEDSMGRRLYKNKTDLETALLVSKIVPVPASYIPSNIYGVIVNLSDYNVGADKGGSINMFEDFDIDYNQQKYLIETRCSGALVKPYSAITLNRAN